MNNAMNLELENANQFTKKLKQIVFENFPEDSSVERPEFYLNALALSHFLEVAAKRPASTGRD